ncbi:FAR1-related sequence 5-like protein [Tanacetum coccineum]
MTATIIGIDLGTTYSCVAVWRNNRVEIIPNEQGNRTTPSCVAFSGTERLIGDAAKNQITVNPINSVFGDTYEKTHETKIYLNSGYVWYGAVVELFEAVSGAYDKAVNSRRAAEEDEDFKTMNSRAVLSSVHPIEAKAGKCYTRKIFEKFEKEWKEATNNLTHNTLNKSLEQVTYSVGQVNVEKKYWRTVNFSLLNKVDATCSCAMFETYGILCKHILYVMKKKHVETLPDQYILPRWTLDSRYKADEGFARQKKTIVNALHWQMQLWVKKKKDKWLMFVAFGEIIPVGNGLMVMLLGYVKWAENGSSGSVDKEECDNWSTIVALDFCIVVVEGKTLVVLSDVNEL